MLHVVLIKPKADVDAEAVTKLRTALAALQDQIPGVTDFRWGPNVSIENMDRGYKLGFVMTLENLAARDAYLPHPAHLAVLPLAGAVAEEVLVFDIDA